MAEDSKGEWVVELSVKRARRLAGEGDIEGAYDILVGVSGHNNRTSLLQLRTEWRNKLLEQLRKQFADLTVYPMQTAKIKKIKEYALRSREAYVITLFDGMTSIEDALAVSPVDELDTLRGVARLLDLGLLSIGAPA